MRSSARVALRIVGAVLACVLFGSIWQACAASRGMRQIAPAGQLVDVGGHKLHLQCVGTGSPTVILEASGLGNASSWRKVQPQVAARTRVCAYDRAGMGHSEPGPLPRDGRQLAAELRALLQAAQLPPPYLLVGHSAGGVVVRLFAAAHPTEVAGLVLVDTATDDALAAHPEIVARMKRALWAARIEVRVGLLRLFDPFHLDARDAALTYRPQVFDAAYAMVAAFPQTFAQLAAARFPDLPTVVLTHGKPGDWAGPGLIRSDEADALEQAWQSAQATLVRRSTAGKLVIAGASGHQIPDEQPDLVTHSILDLLH